MKHWFVPLAGMGGHSIQEAETAEQAVRQVYEQFIQKALRATKYLPCPCQWGEDCPEIYSSCSECKQKMEAANEKSD